MSLVTIRCRSCTPVPAAELTDWLQRRLSELRAQAPALRVRLAALSQPLPETTIEAGWLIELEAPVDLPREGAEPLDGVLADLLRDMRILGLAPTVLAPAGREAAGGRGRDALP